MHDLEYILILHSLPRYGLRFHYIVSLKIKFTTKNPFYKLASRLIHLS